MRGVAAEAADAARRRRGGTVNSDGGGTVTVVLMVSVASRCQNRPRPIGSEPRIVPGPVPWTRGKLHHIGHGCESSPTGPVPPLPSPRNERRDHDDRYPARRPRARRGARCAQDADYRLHSDRTAINGREHAHTYTFEDNAPCFHCVAAPTQAELPCTTSSSTSASSDGATTAGRYAFRDPSARSRPRRVATAAPSAHTHSRTSGD